MATTLQLYCPRCNTPVTGFNPYQELDSDDNVAYFRAWHQDHVCPGRGPDPSRPQTPVEKAAYERAIGERVATGIIVETIPTTGEKAGAVIDAVGIEKFVRWMGNMRGSTALTPEDSVNILYRNHVTGRR